jgi:hypothetical protein
MKLINIPLLLLICIAAVFSECKEKKAAASATIKVDKTEALCSNAWIIDEVIRNVGGVNGHFIRGGINTTGTNYQNFKIKFNSDGTGKFTDDRKETFPLTWSWVGNKQQNLRIDVSGFAIYDWDMVELHENYLYCTTSGFKNNNMNTARYIQIPSSR